MFEQLHSIDIAIIAAFVVLQTYIGLRGRKRGRGRTDAAEYLLGGRRLTLPAFVATLVATWYGGILGVGEYSYLYGISNWLVFGVPYYLWAIVFAVFLARRARRTLFFSLPDHLDQAYGTGPAVTGGAMVFIMTVPSAYVLMLGTLGSLLLGWPLWAGVVLGAVISGIYVLTGGFEAIVRTDRVQAAAMYFGFALILPFAVAKYGGWSFITGNVPATHLTWTGGNTVWFILSWYFIAAQTLVEPSFYQRCYAAKSEQVARRGIFLSVAFWIVFDFLTTFTGLYVRAAIADLPDAKAAYPALAFQVLPPGFLGIFIVGLLATIVSTVDSYMFLSAISLGRDVVCRLKASTDRMVNRATRWSLIASAALAILLALSSRSIIGLWRDLGSVGVPVLLLPMLFSFGEWLKDIPGRWVVWWMVIPGLVSAGWIAIRITTDSYPWGLEPIFPGLAVSVGMVLILRWFAGGRA
jgi:SSS family solute:Na+ symporter